MSLELVFDLVLAVLLMAAIVGGWLLNQRLQIIRKGQEELASLVRQLNEATGRAQSSVQELKQAGADIEDKLRGEIGKARALADELALITEAGDNLAGRLEQRLVGTVSAPGQGDADDTGEDIEDIIVDEDDDILGALKEAR